MHYPIQKVARLGGWLYLLLIVLGFLGEMVARAQIVRNGDVAATAYNLKAMETLWRWGILAEVVAFLSVTLLSAIYYVIFRPVSRLLNLITAFLRIIATAIESVALLQLIAALSPLGSAPYLKAFSVPQLQALSSMCLKSFSSGYMMAFLFFGFCFLFHGQLIVRSNFLPRFIGRMIQVAGYCYFGYGVLNIVYPLLAQQLFPLILAPAFVAEMTLSLWLIIKGVDKERWHAMNAGNNLSLSI